MDELKMRLTLDIPDKVCAMEGVEWAAVEFPLDEYFPYSYYLFCVSVVSQLHFQQGLLGDLF
jgi:hypothetical protein